MKEPNVAQMKEFWDFWEIDRERLIRWNRREPYGSRIDGPVGQVAERLQDRILREHIVLWNRDGCPAKFYPILTAESQAQLCGELPADGQRDAGTSGFPACDAIAASYGEHNFSHDWNEP